MNFKSTNLLGLSVSCLTLVSILCSSALAKPNGGGSENCTETQIPTIVCPVGWDLAKDMAAHTNKCTAKMVKIKVCKSSPARLDTKPLGVIAPASAKQ
jgi:hypothetical protein